MGVTCGRLCDSEVKRQLTIGIEHKIKLWFRKFRIQALSVKTFMI